eukprot:CFRG0448T1
MSDAWNVYAHNISITSRDAITPLHCPVCPCFTCDRNDTLCSHSGKCTSNGACLCPPGFLGESCTDLSCMNNGLLNSQGSCSCNQTDGWGGIWCQNCENDQVCQKMTGGTPSSRCDRTWAPFAKKTYSCETTEDSIAGILGQPALLSVSLYVNTDNPNATRRGGSFQLLRKEDQNTPRRDLFSCMLENCNDTTDQHAVEATSGGFAWSCSEVKCMMNCKPGDDQCSPILSGIVAVVGGPMEFMCDGKSELCTVQERHLGAIARGGVHMKCKGGECVHTAPTPTPKFDPSKQSPLPIPPDPDVDGVIPLTVIVVLASIAILSAVVAGFFVCFFLRRQRLQKEYIAFNHQDVNTYLRGLRNKSGSIRTLAFDELCYTIGKGKNSKYILKNVSGYSRPGQILAIMGPSGAGKSTVMDILSMRHKAGRTTGSITIGGRSRTRAFKRDIGFVDQEDLLIPTLTVMETLMYSAELRLPDSVPYDVRQRRVRTVLEDLSITHIAHSRIGGSFIRGISGGEKRRVSIGTELVTCPSILFLDEPTSGLDSYNAHLVVSCLSRLARNDRTNVIMTIHQPRSNIFTMFDKLLLLSKGQNIFFGPASQASAYFASIGLVCPNNYNPADFLIDATVEAEMREAEKEKDRDRSILLGRTRSGTIRASDDDALLTEAYECGAQGGSIGGDVELNTHTVSLMGTTEDDEMFLNVDGIRSTINSESVHETTAVSKHGINMTTTDMVKKYQDKRELYEREEGLLGADGVGVGVGYGDGESGDASSSYTVEDLEYEASDNDDEGAIGQVDRPGHARVGSGQIFSGDLGGNGRCGDNEEELWSENDNCIDEDMIDISDSVHMTGVYNGAMVNSDRQFLEGHLNSATNINSERRRRGRPNTNIPSRKGKSKEHKKQTNASFMTQILVLSNRTMLNLFRNPLLFFGHVLSAVIIGLVVGCVYYGMNENIETTGSGSKSLVGQFEQRLGVLLIMCAFLAFGSLSSLELFYSERALYMHERANRFYYPSTYFISKILFDLVPLRIIPPLIMGSIAYFMIGLRPGIVYFMYFLVALVLVNLVATSICMVIGVLCSRLSTGNLIASMIMLFSLMLTNIFNNKATMPPYLKWLHYVSFFNYGYEALCVNELDGIYLQGKILDAHTEVAGTQILIELGFETEHFMLDIYVLMGMIVLCLFIAYMCLKYFVRQKR